MAELLIYNKEHWMDNLTPLEVSQRSKDSKHFLEKYNARTQKGDIVEVRKDKAPHTEIEKASFAIIKVPGLSYEDGRYLMEPLTDENMTGFNKIAKRRKHYINKDFLPSNIKDELDQGKIVSITVTELNTAKVQKSL